MTDLKTAQDMMAAAVAAKGTEDPETASVKRILKLPGLPGPDAADALGLAITHAHSGLALSRLAAAGASTRKHYTQPGAGGSQAGDERDDPLFSMTNAGHVLEAQCHVAEISRTRRSLPKTGASLQMGT